MAKFLISTSNTPNLLSHDNDSNLTPIPMSQFVNLSNIARCSARSAPFKHFVIGWEAEAASLEEITRALYWRILVFSFSYIFLVGLLLFYIISSNVAKLLEHADDTAGHLGTTTSSDCASNIVPERNEKESYGANLLEHADDTASHLGTTASSDCASNIVPERNEQESYGANLLEHADDTGGHRGITALSVCASKIVPERNKQQSSAEIWRRLSEEWDMKAEEFRASFFARPRKSNATDTTLQTRPVRTPYEVSTPRQLHLFVSAFVHEIELHKSMQSCLAKCVEDSLIADTGSQDSTLSASYLCGRSLSDQTSPKRKPSDRIGPQKIKRLRLSPREHPRAFPTKPFTDLPYPVDEKFVVEFEKLKL